MVAVVVGDEAGARDALAGAADTVVTLAGDGLSPYGADAWTDGLASLLGGGAAAAGVPAAAPGDLVLFGEGTRTREVLPRVAARLGAHAVTNAIDLALDGGRAVVTRPVVGGKAYGRFVCDGVCLLAFRPNSFSADEAGRAWRPPSSTRPSPWGRAGSRCWAARSRATAGWS